jgi:hypothetical protein
VRESVQPPSASDGVSREGTRRVGLGGAWSSSLQMQVPILHLFVTECLSIASLVLCMRSSVEYEYL